MLIAMHSINFKLKLMAIRKSSHSYFIL